MIKLDTWTVRYCRLTQQHPDVEHKRASPHGGGHYRYQGNQGVASPVVGGNGGEAVQGDGARRGGGRERQQVRGVKCWADEEVQSKRKIKEEEET